MGSVFVAKIHFLPQFLDKNIKAKRNWAALIGRPIDVG